MSHTNPYDDFNERKNSKSSLIYVHLLSCGFMWFAILTVARGLHEERESDEDCRS